MVSWFGGIIFINRNESISSGRRATINITNESFRLITKVFCMFLLFQKLENLQVLKFFLVSENTVLYSEKKTFFFGQICVPKIPDMGPFRNNFIPSKILWDLKMRFFFDQKCVFFLESNISNRHPL